MKQQSIQHEFRIKAFCSAHDFNWNSKFAFPGESHDSWEVVYVMSGAVEVVEGTQIYHLSEGNMILHAPMEFHTIRSAGGTSPHVLILSFVTTGVLPEQLSKRVFLLSEEEKKEYGVLFSRILSFYWKDIPDSYEGQACADSLSAFLIRLGINHVSKEQLFCTRDAYVYREIIEAMVKSLHNNLSLKEIADQVPISVSYVKVLFNRYAGISPKAYYDRMRCTEAIRLLHCGLSATQTAESLHFSSPSYFSVFFKRMTGLPPAEYIQQELAKRG